MTNQAEVFIPLSQGLVAVIDFDDFEKVRGFKWYAQKMGRCVYAHRNVPIGDKHTTISLHRFLTGCPPGMEINHINGDGLDNRRENLQIVTHQQNAFAKCQKRKDATSKYRGVTWNKQHNCWQAKIRHCGKDSHLGWFDSEEDAARAYDAKAIELFGEHAAPNFNFS